MKNLILVGSHAGSTALSIVKEIKKQKKDKEYKLYWVGNKYAMEGEKALSFEFQILPSEGVEFINVNSGRIQRKFGVQFFVAFLKLITNFVIVFQVFIKIKPDVILSFGGASSFWVVLIGKLFFNAKVYLHEQTSCVGRANQITGIFADKIFLARESSQKYFPRNKTLVVGNPISPYLLGKKRAGNYGKKPNLIITGGSRGSLAINKLIIPYINKYAENFNVIHQTGKIDYEKVKNEILKLGIKNYHVYDFVLPEKWAEYLLSSDILFGRSGANTVSDVLYLKLPAVFVPLPIAYKDEQYYNALEAEKVGLVKIIRQNEATPEKIFNLISELVSVKVNDFENIDEYSSEKIVKEVCESSN